MQSQNQFLADLAKIANSVAGTAAGVTREARETARERLRQQMAGFDFVGRDEFEAVKAVAAAAREEADALRERVVALEAAQDKSG